MFYQMAVNVQTQIMHSKYNYLQRFNNPHIYPPLTFLSLA